MAVPRPGSGTNDGWNDPPVFTYNAVSLGTSPNRTHLNKRVSFPLTGETCDTTGNPMKESLVPRDPNAAGMLLNPKDGPPKLPPVHILPPTSSTSVHPPVPLLLSNLSPPADHSALPPSFISAIRDPQKLETLPELLKKLDLDSADSLRKYTKKVLHEMVEVCKDGIQGRSKEDVLTRLSLLDDQWRDEKLSEKAKVKLGSLAFALKSNDLKQADSLHLSLMVDHISEVNQWMVGVKRVINELKILQSSPLSSSPEKFPMPSGASAPEESSAAEDVCVDTSKFTDLKPVLMPEMLVPASGEGKPNLPDDGSLHHTDQLSAEQQQHQDEPSVENDIERKANDEVQDKR